MGRWYAHAVNWSATLAAWGPVCIIVTHAPLLTLFVGAPRILPAPFLQVPPPPLQAHLCGSQRHGHTGAASRGERCVSAMERQVHGSSCRRCRRLCLCLHRRSKRMPHEIGLSQLPVLRRDPFLHPPRLSLFCSAATQSPTRHPPAAPAVARRCGQPHGRAGGAGAAAARAGGGSRGTAAPEGRGGGPQVCVSVRAWM